MTTLTTVRSLTPFYCHTCGRMEGVDSQTCPDCGARRQYVSRLEWFLGDALEAILDGIGLPYRLEQQWPLRDSHGFTWYFDLGLWIERRGACLIEVNGASHLSPKNRDDDKYRAARLNGLPVRIVANDECRLASAHETAASIVGALIRTSAQ